MKRITAILTLTLCVVLYLAEAQAARAADGPDAADPAQNPAGAPPMMGLGGAGNPDILYEDAAKDAPTSGTSNALVVELNKLTEELCFQALTNFIPTNSQNPVSALGTAPNRRAVTRTNSAQLNRVLTEFVSSIDLIEGEKVGRISNEIVLEKNSKIGDTIKLNDRYNELKAALNDRNASPMNDADLDDLVTLISGFLAPIKIMHNGNGFGPDDYSIKATYETNLRKFRLNIIKHDGKYLWFIEEGI